MDGVTRRDAMKLAAAVGGTALGTSALLAGEKKGPKAGDKKAERGRRNAGKHVESKASLAVVGPRQLFAVVNANGTLARGLGALSAKKLGFTGEYEVIFVRDVRRGAYVASIGLSGSSGASSPGQITVVGRVSDVRGVFIETTDAAGKPADRGFHLFVINPEGFAS